MKFFRSALGALISLCFTAAALAADPSGSWRWAISAPDGEKIEVTLKLSLKDGKLSGNYKSPFGEAAISNASIKEDAIAFDVQREFNGTRFVVKYAGKIAGDAITGTVEISRDADAESPKLEWNATRLK
ncbi:MAG TPA: hypothetical protein VHO24_20810 [Opitutaceae bacterium]|nr:hypothetical protein [Opitutaceae bacterium]